MVDTRDLKSLGPCARAGSSPAPGTSKIKGLAVMAGPFVFCCCFAPEIFINSFFTDLNASAGTKGQIGTGEYFIIKSNSHVPNFFCNIR